MRDPSDYIALLYCRENHRAIADWLHEQGRLHTANGTPSAAAVQEVIDSESWPLSAEASELYDIVQAQIDGAMESPWSTEQLPPLAEWLDANRASLDLLVEASRRPRYYSPLIAPTDTADETLLGLLPLDSVQRVRTIARDLSVRAMFHLGEGHPEQAWQDLLAIHRWARLVAQGPTVAEQLVAIAIDGIACDGTRTLLDSDQITPALGRQIHQDLLALPPPSDMAESFDLGERLSFLDFIVAVRSGGAGDTAWGVVHVQRRRGISGSGARSRRLERHFEARQRLLRPPRRCLPSAKPYCGVSPSWAGLPMTSIQWNRGSTRPQTGLSGAFNQKKRSEMVATTRISTFCSTTKLVVAAEDRANTELDFVRLAAALAVYRADHGHYPDKLADLVPDVLPKLPVDLYHQQPFLYQRDGKGYLLYCTGENGSDDGGSNEQSEIFAGRFVSDLPEPDPEAARQKIPAGADDIAIRVPHPAFKLPTPPAPSRPDTIARHARRCRPRTPAKAIQNHLVDRGHHSPPTRPLHLPTLGPNPPIIVSKQTTYITAPLRPDGLPDYIQYLRDHLREGVTPENNAAVLMWQAFGPGVGTGAISPENWKAISSELKLPHLTDSHDLDPYNEVVIEAVGSWLRESHPERKQDSADDGLEMPNTVFSQADPRYDAIDEAYKAPWRAEQLPPLVEWLQTNRARLDLLVKASRRTRYYSPFPAPASADENTLLCLLPLDGIQRARTIARALSVRAMLQLGEGRPELAWQDLLAIHRWARLVGQGPTIIEQLVAIAIDGIACQGTTTLLGSDQMTPALARQIQQDLLALPPTSDMADCFDQGERLYFLDAVIAASKEGAGSLLNDSFNWDDGERNKTFQPFDLLSANWNTTLAEGNRLFDRLVAACRLPNHAAQGRV